MSRLAIGRAEPADLPQQPEQLRPAGGEAEHRPHQGLDAVAARARRGPGPASSAAGELGRRPVDHRLEQRLLRPEVVQDRLLAHAEPGGQAVERRAS